MYTVVLENQDCAGRVPTGPAGWAAASQSSAGCAQPVRLDAPYYLSIVSWYLGFRVWGLGFRA